MKFGTFLLAACAAFAMPALADDATKVAGDEGTFDSFRNFCVATGADETAALAAADHAGWMPIPKPMLDKFSTGGPLEKPQGRIRMTTTAVDFLIVAQGKLLDGSHLTGPVCAIGATPADYSKIWDTDAAQIAAVPEDLSGDGSAGLRYIWREKDGEHIPVVASDMKSALEKGTLNILATHVKGDMTIIAFSVISQGTAQ